MKKYFVLAALALAALAPMRPVLAQDKTIVEIAAGNADFSTLVSLVKAAGLAETLSGTGPLSPRCRSRFSTSWARTRQR